MEPPEITLVTQPPLSSCCGQACLAMISGKTLQEAQDAIGHAGPTGSWELQEGLKKLTSDFRLLKYNPTVDSIPETCIAKMKCPTCPRHSHWVVLWNGKIYDPSGENVRWEIVGTLEIRRNVISKERLKTLFYRGNRIDQEKLTCWAELLEDVFKLGMIGFEEDFSNPLVKQVLKIAQRMEQLDPDFTPRTAAEFKKMIEVSNVETPGPVCVEIPAGPYTSGFPDPFSCEDSGRDPFDRPGGDTAQRQ